MIQKPLLCSARSDPPEAADTVAAICSPTQSSQQHGESVPGDNRIFQSPICYLLTVELLLFALEKHGNQKIQLESEQIHDF